MNAFRRESLRFALVLCLALAATVWEKKLSDRAAGPDAQAQAAWEAASPLR